MSQSDKLMKFEIVTPEKVVLEESVMQVTLPTQDGEITVLPNHIPLVSVLKPGVIEVKNKEGQSEIMSVSGGFIEVFKNRVVILADSAERAEEIDLQKVEQARTRAEEAVKEIRHIDQEQFAEVSARLEKELARFRAVSRWRKLKAPDNKH